jgi:hypothetical protein
VADLMATRVVSTKHTSQTRCKHGHANQWTWLKRLNMIKGMGECQHTTGPRTPVIFSGGSHQTGPPSTFMKMKSVYTNLKIKMPGIQICPQNSPIITILKDTWNWKLRSMNWVASIWPQSNSILFPTLVGLQTTKEQVK